MSGSSLTLTSPAGHGRRERHVVEVVGPESQGEAVTETVRERIDVERELELPHASVGLLPEDRPAAYRTIGRSRRIPSRSASSRAAGSRLSASFSTRASLRG